MVGREKIMVIWFSCLSIGLSKVARPLSDLVAPLTSVWYGTCRMVCAYSLEPRVCVEVLVEAGTWSLLDSALLVRWISFSMRGGVA